MILSYAPEEYTKYEQRILRLCIAMVSIDVVRSANAALVKTEPFVAVVAGGTSGIGKNTVIELARTFGDQGAELRVYIVGRNEGAAKDLIAECERICPAGTFRFVGADLSLIREVDKVCASISKTEDDIAKSKGKVAKIDFLVLCQGLLSFGGREGLFTGRTSFYLPH